MDLERALVLLIATLIISAVNMMMSARLPSRLNGGVLAAIDEAIRKQDERIQKRLERSADKQPTPARQPFPLDNMSSGDWIPPEIYDRF